jgi:predicted TIM-barrel fold metal-dependent hydrolase
VGTILTPAVDVHAHYLPDAYREALSAAGIDRPDGFPYVPDWEPETALAAMDEIGIQVAMLSISSPGVHIGPRESTRALARRVNEDGAAVVAAHPKRFGLLASLPLPDVDAALEELAYASDVLSVDGFVLMSNYNGSYPADQAFTEVIGELHRRAAVVALHPTSPPGWEALTLGRPRPMLEFPMDTTRAVIDLVLSRTLQRRPGIRWIVPHVGSGLVALADRVAEFAALFLTDGDEEIDVFAELGKLYYDVTGPTLPHALPALLTLADPDHLLYGSDLPFAPMSYVRQAAQALVATDVVDERQRSAMFAANAAALFPRVADIVAATT